MAQIGDLDRIWTKRKALVAFFPYAVRWERGGDRTTFDAYFGILEAPKVKDFVARQIATLLDEAGPTSPNWTVTLVLPYADWGLSITRSPRDIVTRWAEVASTVPYTEEFGQSVVDTLLQIACDDLLQPYIPVDIWAWLKQRPSLPPICDGRSEGTTSEVVRRVRELGNVEILESYFLLVWSEWDYIYSKGLTEMCTSIREDLGGIGMGRHREILIKRLDDVLGELATRWLGHFRQHIPSLDQGDITVATKQYGELKEVLLEVDKEALGILTSTPSMSINLFN